MLDQFIGTAEEHGLIDALTEQVITSALAQVVRWRAEGLLSRIAVNVSMDNLASLAFPDLVAALATPEWTRMLSHWKSQRAGT